MENKQIVIFLLGFYTGWTVMAGIALYIYGCN